MCGVRGSRKRGSMSTFFLSWEWKSLLAAWPSFLRLFLLDSLRWQHVLRRVGESCLSKHWMQFCPLRGEKEEKANEGLGEEWRFGWLACSCYGHNNPVCEIMWQGVRERGQKAVSDVVEGETSEVICRVRKEVWKKMVLVVIFLILVLLCLWWTWYWRKAQQCSRPMLCWGLIISLCISNQQPQIFPIKTALSLFFTQNVAEVKYIFSYLSFLIAFLLLQ